MDRLHRLFDAVAGGSRAIGETAHFRPLALAALVSEGAAWMERAAGRRIERTWHLTRSDAASALRMGDVRIVSSSSCVWGCRGLAKSVSVSASSTIRPRYITAIRSDMWRTTLMSWLMKIGQPHLVLQLAHEVQDLRLDRHVECRGRLVADEEFRFAGKSACNRDALALSARNSCGNFAPSEGARPTMVSNSPTRSMISASELRSFSSRSTRR